MIKKVILTGRVQGVGCRGYCAKYARKYSINGSASNLYDGSVKLLINVTDVSAFNCYISSLLSNSERYMFYGHIEDISITDYSGKIDGDYNF